MALPHVWCDAGMDLAHFHLLFGNSIRAWLDWDALDTASVQVTDEVVTSPADLGHLYTVWYAGPHGEAGDWRNADHSPQTVAEAAASPGSWTEDKKRRIDIFREQYSTLSEPLVTLAPAYRAYENLILLDSSHRCVAAYLAGIKIRMLVLAIEGPVDSHVLPDLGWFIRNKPFDSLGA